MADVRPFAAVMPPRDKARQVANPPYDVVDAQEAASIATKNPIGFLHVARAEIDLPPDVDPYDARVYERARHNYQRLCRNVPLTRDESACYYVYALEMEGLRQVGVVAAAALDDYDADIIKKHEYTRKVKEDDRTSHILALRSQTGPIFLTYGDSAEIHDVVARACASEPLFDFVAHRTIRHTGWRVPVELNERLAEAFARVPCLYIADGHHRAASASRARETLRQANPAHDGTEDYNGVLSVIFPASQVRVLPYNRVVHGLNGHTPETLLDRLRTVGSVEPADTPQPQAAGQVHVYLDGAWWRLTFGGATEALPPAARLDVSLLQDRVLEPVLGIADPRTDERIEFVGGIRGTDALVKAVEADGADVAFSMYPVSVEQLMAIADAGAVMPPKSTWFEPKLRDGLFTHDI